MTAEAFYESCLESLAALQSNAEAMAVDLTSAVVALHAVVMMMCGVFLYLMFWGRRR